MLYCQHCDYTTAYSRCLKKHSRKHTVGIFHCQLCNYKMKYPNKLEAHSSKHTGGKALLRKILPKSVI